MSSLMLGAFSSMLWLSYCLPRVTFYELRHLKTSRYAYKVRQRQDLNLRSFRSTVFRTASISLSDTLPKKFLKRIRTSNTGSTCKRKIADNRMTKVTYTAFFH